MHVLTLLVRATPASAILGVVAWEVTCLRHGIPNRHRGLVYCVAASIWAIYYGVLAIIDVAHQRMAIGIVAGGLSVMATSVARRVFWVASDLEPADLVGDVAPVIPVDSSMTVAA